MKPIVACCGILCTDCPIYKLNNLTDKVQKELILLDIKSMCKARYGMEYETDDFYCEGCWAENAKLFIACRDCRIRECALNKGIDNCAYCEDYYCENLEEIFYRDPSAARTLNLIRINKGII